MYSLHIFVTSIFVTCIRYTYSLHIVSPCRVRASPMPELLHFGVQCYVSVTSVTYSLLMASPRKYAFTHQCGRSKWAACVLGGKISQREREIHTDARTHARTHTHTHTNTYTHTHTHTGQHTTVAGCLSLDVGSVGEEHQRLFGEREGRSLSEKGRSLRGKVGLFLGACSERGRAHCPRENRPKRPIKGAFIILYCLLELIEMLISYYNINCLYHIILYYIIRRLRHALGLSYV